MPLVRCSRRPVFLLRRYNSYHGPASVAPIGAAIMAGEGLGAATAREPYIATLDFGETEDNRTGLGKRLYDFGFTGSMNAFLDP